MFANDGEVQECLDYWQKALGLQDWTIFARLGIPKDLPNDAMGTVHMGLEKRSAEIILLHSDHHNERPAWVRDQEVDLVHELAHVLLYPMWKGLSPDTDDAQGLAYYGEEWACESLARALVGEKRKACRCIRKPTVEELLKL